MTVKQFIEQLQHIEERTPGLNVRFAARHFSDRVARPLGFDTVRLDRDDEGPVVYVHCILPES